MSNFRVVRGDFIEMQEDVRNLKKGIRYQILNLGYSIAFVGIHGQFSYKELAGKMLPVYE